MTTSPIPFNVDLHLSQLPDHEAAERWAVGAWTHQCKRLEGFGNVLSTGHWEALLAVQQGLVLQTFDTTKRRLSYALETGMGKTQALVSYCLVGVQHGHLSSAGGRSVVIAAAQVEQLCTLLRDMVDAGVPRDSIGLYHSYSQDPAVNPLHGPQDGYRPPTGKASCAPDADAFDRPILLATHMQTRGDDAAWMFQFEGRPRSLMVFDESLFRSEVRSLDWNELRGAIALAAEFLPATSRPVEFIQGVRTTLMNELAAQEGADSVQISYRGEKQGRGPQVIRFEVPQDLSEIREAIDAAAKANSARGHKAWRGALTSFLDMFGDPLTIVPSTSGGPGIIQFEPSVSDTLDNVAILDASYFVRRLYELDDTIRPVQGLDGGIKTYPGTKVKWYRAGSGRQFTTDDLRKGPESFYSRYIVEAIKEAGDLPALVFTFGKQNARDFKELDCEASLRQDLKDAGIDPDALIADGRKRVNFLTWGSETSRSDLKFCKVVVFAGVLHQDRHNVRARMSGQARSLTINPEPQTITGTVTSETIHSVMQAVNRSQARVITNGAAGAVVVHLPLYGADEITGVMSALPGADMERVVPEFLLSPEARAAVGRIAAFLLNGESELKTSVSLLSIGKLFPKGEKPSRRTMEAAHAHIEDLGKWKRDPATRSLVRTT